MNFTHTMSREELRNLPTTNLKNLVKNIVESTVRKSVIDTAGQGQTSYLWTRKERDYRVSLQNQSILEIPDAMFIEAIQERFPGTTVEAREEWVETRPGVKEHKKGILIDWS
jgi:hypothetical protein